LLLLLSENKFIGRSPGLHEKRKTHYLSNAQSSVFMRVRRTVPQFTFGFSASFVNQISSVSTGFFRFSSVLSGFWFIPPQKPNKTALCPQPLTLPRTPPLLLSVLFQPANYVISTEATVPSSVA
jgi:hypothetical protein